MYVIDSGVKNECSKFEITDKYQKKKKLKKLNSLPF